MSANYPDDGLNGVRGICWGLIATALAAFIAGMVIALLWKDA